MLRSSIEEYAEAIRQRYLWAGRKEKRQILDEFTNTTGYHRKAAIRLLNGDHRKHSGRRKGRCRVYGPQAVGALKAAWEASDRVCSKRLKPFLAELVSVLKAHGEMKATIEVEEQLCRLSESTIDRLLKPHKVRGSRRSFSTTKPGTLLKDAIPIRTFADWKEKLPGFFEGDLVAHCGEQDKGFYLNTLSAVDVATRLRRGWSARRCDDGNIYVAYTLLASGKLTPLLLGSVCGTAQPRAYTQSPRIDLVPLFVTGVLYPGT